MKQKHTESPWFFDSQNRTVHSAAGELIATLHDWQGDAESEANGKLIVAFPNLAEALRNLVLDWERCHGELPADHEAKAVLSVLDKE